MTNQESDILNFFHLDSKCPESIKNCSKLRQEYIQRVETAKKFKNCNECNINHIKLYIINKIKFNE